MWPPACSPSGNVSPPSRRGGACPSRWFPEGFHFTRRFSPEGRNSVRQRAESSRPTGVMVHGRRAGQSPAPTTSQADHSKTGGRAGQSPAPTMFQADHSKNGQRAHAVRPYGGSRKSQQRRTAFLRTAHRQNQQKPPQLFPVLYSNISQKFSFVTIMSQYYGFVTLRPNPLTGGLH